MRIEELKINTDIFTRYTITDYGVRLEHFDKDGFKNNNPKKLPSAFFMLAVHVLDTGGININAVCNNHLSDIQLDEIIRIREILRKNKKEKTL